MWSHWATIGQIGARRGRAAVRKRGCASMDGLNAQDLPQPTRDLDQAKSDLDRAGYCLLADALDAGRLAAVRGRLYEQALAERQAGTAYFDGAPHQNWGTFRDRDGRPRTHAFSEADGGVNQRLWMLVNKGEEFLGILEHAGTRALIGHVLGDAYVLSSFIANITNPGGVPMKLHTDQWWMPAPAYRNHKLRVGSITRDHFEVDGAGPPAMIAPAACCNIMWLLDDFSEENGATRVVPGSHLSGRQPEPRWCSRAGCGTAPAPTGAGTPAPAC